MPRAVGMFLLMFSLLSLIVHLDEMAQWFAGGAAALLAIDLLLLHNNSRAARFFIAKTSGSLSKAETPHFL